jgi:hypothetical protein
MTDSLFWHLVAIGGLVLLAMIAVLLVLNLRRRPTLDEPRHTNVPVKPSVDGDATLTAFDALCDRDEEYEDFERPNQELVESENLKEYAAQFRKFAEAVLSLAAPLPETHSDGVDPLLVIWDTKMVAWYAAVAEHQYDYAALLERAIAHDDSQTVVGWIVESAIGFWAYDPLVKVREYREANKFFDDETVKIVELQDKLLSQREAYLAELARLELVYAKRWDWPIEDDECQGSE